ncbi:MAG: hypothetical protein NTY71_02475 [Methanoregula sp.]|jgi:hypothetical protein|nr:hypothetical protein [Methanoregula sp.]
MAEKETPLGIVFLGILSIIIGLMSVRTGLSLAVLPSYLGGFGLIAGILLLVIGIIDGIFGVGCFLAWSWVWIVGVILLVFSILLQIVALLAMARVSLSALDYGIIIGILMAGIILY